MSDNAFGLADEAAPETDPFADSPVVDQTEEVETEAPETDLESVDEAPAPDPFTPPPAEEAEEPETAEDEAAPEPEKLPTPFLGKYETVEAAEAAYNELRREQVRLDQENRQKEEWLRVAAQTIEESKQPPAAPQPLPTPTDAEFQQVADQYGVDVETIKVAQAIAQQQVQAQVAPLQQQMQTTQEQQRAQQEWAQQQQQIQQTYGLINSWRQANPVDERTESLMVDVFEELDLDENLAENYPIALEVAQNIELRSILNGLPDLVNTDQGMNLARTLASGSTDTQAPRAARNTPEARRQAHVESGPSGATPPTATPKMDAWDKVKALAVEDRKNDSPLGV